MRAKGKAGEFRDFSGDALRKFRVRVESCAHRGSADSKIVQAVQRLLQPPDVALQKTCPAAELLAERKRYGILQMGTADFNHVFELFRLGRDCVLNALNRGN